MNRIVPFALALALALALASARPAHALSCAASYVRLLSPAEQDAPLNARVLVEVFAMKGQTVELDTIALRVKGAAAALRAARQLRAGSGDIRIVELVPAARLAPATGYELVWGRGATLRAVGGFTTGRVADRTAPVLRELKARFLDQESSNPWWGPGKRRHRYLHLKLGRGAGEPVTPVALWLAPGGGKLDYTRPPTTYYSDYPDGVALGQTPSACPLTNLELPVGKGRTLRLGVRAVDGAGNLSSPLEAELDLGRPER